MSEKVVFLKFRGPDTKDEYKTSTICKACKNRTFTLVDLHGIESYPELICAACGAHLGKIDWVTDDK